MCSRSGSGSAVLFSTLTRCMHLQVGQWLLASNLAAYVEVFSVMEVTGADLHGFEDDELKKYFVC